MAINQRPINLAGQSTMIGALTPQMLAALQAQQQAPPSDLAAELARRNATDQIPRDARRQAMIDALDAGMTQPLNGGGYGEALARFGESYLRTRNGARSNERDMRVEALAREQEQEDRALRNRGTLAQVLAQEQENTLGPERWEDIPQAQLPAGTLFGQRNTRTNQAEFERQPAPPAALLQTQPGMPVSGAAGYVWGPNGTMQAAEGGPADIRANEEGRARADRLASSASQLQNAIGILASVEPRISGWNSGMLMGGALQGFNQDAINIRESLEPVIAILAFESLAEMRRNSETGGALGSIAVRELDLLSRTVRSLATEQSPEQLRQNISATRAQLERTLAAIQAAQTEIVGAENSPVTTPEPSAAPPASDAPMTPEQIQARLRQLEEMERRVTSGQ